MTPKETAKQVFDKYLQLQELIEWGNNDLKKEAGLIYEKNNIEYDNYYNELAKQSALIAVNYIITSNPHSNPFNTDVHSTMDYWQEVMCEIKKL